VVINNTALYLGQAIGSGIGGALFARGKVNAMGFVALFLVATSFTVVWMTRSAPDLFGSRLNSDIL